MKMQTPQIIYLALTGIGFLFNVISDGKERTGKHSLGAWFIDTIIVLGLLCGTLAKFRRICFPQDAQTIAKGQNTYNSIWQREIF